MNNLLLSLNPRKHTLAPYVPLINRISPPFVVVLTLLITYFRNPRFFLQPRFWAEEGSLHFAYSYSHKWFMALFHPQVGYLNFWPNLATLLATLPPLQQAPLITTLMALVVQLVPIVLILWSKSPYWNGWFRKLIGISILIFVPLTNEVWLNTINSYNYFALVTFLILLDDPPIKQVRKWSYRALLVIAGLTGTLSCFLIPLFIVQLISDKNTERMFQVLVLVACAVIQVFLIFTYKGNVDFSQRFNLIGLTTFGVTMWTQSIGLLVFGFTRASEWANLLFSLAADQLGNFRMWGRALLVLGAVILFLLSANLPIKSRILFISGYGILMLLPMMFSVIQDKYSLSITGLHQRIFFAPNVLLGWMLLIGIRFSKGPPISRTNIVSMLCSIMLLIALFWGMKSYSTSWQPAVYWPDWKSEVQVWENNPNYSLRIQPEGWFIQLQKH